MNNLWYEIKKLGFMQVDNKCKLCKQSLKNFKEHPLRPEDAMVIVPGINCHGNITHFHIGRIEQSTIQKTKIIKDLKRS